MAATTRPRPEATGEDPERDSAPAAPATGAPDTADADTADAPDSPRPGGRARLTGALALRTRRTVALVQAAHPRQAVATAAVLALAAFVAGRPMTEVGLVAATVLVGQVVLGWHNDLVDAESDQRAGRTGKPLADGRLDPATVWFAVAVGLLALLPLAVANGFYAGAAYAASLLVAAAGNLVLRGSVLSWLPWAVSFALYVPFLSYGGLGGQFEGSPPSPALTALAAALGVCVHVLRALPGLVQDNRDRRRHLPLRLALRTGAPRLLLLTSVVTALVAAATVAVAAASGLSA